MNKKVFVYTDGACRGNPGPGGYGIVIKSDNTVRKINGSSKHTTNNRMELKAAIEGLRALGQFSEVILVTDSKYVVKGMKEWIKGWIKKGWKNSSGKPVKNKDLWEELLDASKSHKVKWEWVQGHSGHTENELCDLLANQAIDNNGA